MPNRYIREGINSSRAVASLDPATEVFYRRMINVVDDFGRFEVDTMLIRSQAFPVHRDISESDIVRWLAACEKAGLLVLYEAAGRQFLVLTKTERPRARNSRYPNPPLPLVERFGLFTCANMCPQAKTFAPNTDTNANTNTRAGDELEPPAHTAQSENSQPSRPFTVAAQPEQSRAREQTGSVRYAEELEPNRSLTVAAQFPAYKSLDEPEAIALTASAGIPSDFAQFVHQDWSSRGGKDCAGNFVSWLPYVIKRWTREQAEWRSGTHRGKKALQAKPLRPPGTPALSEIVAYAREKWGDEPSYCNWANSFWVHWNDPKRQWKRNGALIDWKIELTTQVVKWKGGNVETLKRAPQEFSKPA